ncbi:hypothetical protein BD626DRAFT_151845 [Schizophyllum amplum]|uniref:Uncharacterized protein n=1 Tax=Schizophyllum amplum TaxID=97359 RepID=A0A550C4B4_9AGAR|nr:hypothetical protein BD626DRAFT_151845 [Auriculariopsis ampla]
MVDSPHCGPLTPHPLIPCLSLPSDHFPPRVARYIFVPFTFIASMIYRGARLVVLAARQVAIWIVWLGFYVRFGRLGFDYLLDGWDWVWEAAWRVGYFFGEMEREEKTPTQAENAAAAAASEEQDDDEMPDLEPEEPRRGSMGAGWRGSKKRPGKGRQSLSALLMRRPPRRITMRFDTSLERGRA